jgi:hypothetical protein
MLSMTILAGVTAMARPQVSSSLMMSTIHLVDFGLRPVEEKVTLVRYESAGVFLNVYHGRASFELG